MKIISRLVLFIILCFLSVNLQAEVYKCTDDNSNVVFQGEPCRDAIEQKLDLRFSEQLTNSIDTLVLGSWCEVGVSEQLAGNLQRDIALRKTWQFTEREMVQQIDQGQHSDTFKYAIRQQPGSFVIDHAAFGNGQVSWQVKTLTAERLIIAAYGGFTHLIAGNCDVVMASLN